MSWSACASMLSAVWSDCFFDIRICSLFSVQSSKALVKLDIRAGRSGPTLFACRHKFLFCMTQVKGRQAVTVNSSSHFYLPSSILSYDLYHSHGWFSGWQIDDIFHILPRKQDLTFHADCLHRRQFAWNVKSCFLRKIRNMLQNVVCWNFTQSAKR